MSKFNWEYFLRQFIDMATRYPINGMLEFRTENQPYSSMFEYYITNCRNEWDIFIAEYRKEKIGYNDLELRNHYRDLKGDFYPMIENYQIWYKENIKETEKFEPYNPYRIFNEFCKDTKKEIEKLNLKDDSIKKNSVSNANLNQKLIGKQNKTYNVEYDNKLVQKPILIELRKNEELGQLILEKLLKLTDEIKILREIHDNELPNNFILLKINELEKEITKQTNELDISSAYIVEISTYLKNNSFFHLFLENLEKALGCFLNFISSQLDRIIKFKPWVKDNVNEFSKLIYSLIAISFFIEYKNKTLGKSSFKGFISSLEPHKIKFLYNNLIKGNYIDENTNLEHFKAIFKDESLQDNCKIKWIAEPVLLSYLIFMLKKTKIIRNTNHWSITNNCFEPKCKLRQLADGFQNSKTGKPKNSDEIDTILAKL